MKQLYAPLLVFLTIVLTSCGTQQTTLFRSIAPALSEAQLTAQGLQPIRPDYKSKYPKLLPYLLDNTQAVFNEVQGGFYNLKHPQLSDINIMIGYWKNYGGQKNVIVVLLAMTTTSKGSLNNQEIKIQCASTPHLRGVHNMPNSYNGVQERRTFLLDVDVPKGTSILNKLKNDTVQVTIGDQSYTFRSPEMDDNA